MADKDDKWQENVPGKFYVDEQCIDCDLCRETAPKFFTRNDDGGYSYVHKQPEKPERSLPKELENLTAEQKKNLTGDEKELLEQWELWEECMDALEGCPVDAIGEDGDDSEL